MTEAPPDETTGRLAPVSRVLAAITVFRPRPDLLAALIERLLADGLPVNVLVDGPTGEAIETATLAALRRYPGLKIIHSEQNHGIGAGLNRLVEAAARGGYERLIVFDQDSSPTSGMAEKLSCAMDLLAAAGGRPAVVGPTPIVAAGEAGKAPHYRPRASGLSAGGSRPVDYVITSGSLFDLKACRAVGPFRQDYVIDAIDTEWCFRAWAKGFEVFALDDLPMIHRVGSGTVRLGPLTFPRQSPARMASYVRNQVHGLRLSHVPLRWKLRTIAYLPFQALAYLVGRPDRGAVVRRLLNAAADGMAGRLGPP